MTERLSNLIAFLLSLTISLIACEAGLRLWGGVPLFEFPDFRLRQVIRDTLTGALEYDAILGWRLKSHLSYPHFHTINYGIRRNGPNDDHVRTGGVLVAGASFTAGSEVEDEETWPAQLESLIQQPVVNGGEGGFGADQIVLRAEELLPIVRPTVLVVDLVSDNITTSGYSYSGYPKPYFTIVNDQLVLHNSPVPHYRPLASPKFDFLKDVLAYSYVVDRIMATYFRDYWYSSTGAKFERIANDDVEVTCRLLQRLKKKAKEQNIRTVISMQYGGNYVGDTKARTAPVVLVEECARSFGFQVVDEFDYLRNLLTSDPAAFARHYVMGANGLYGHKSVFGNRQIAAMISQALAEPAPEEIIEASIEPPKSADKAPGNDENRLLKSQSLDDLSSTSTIVSVKRSGDRSALPAFDVSAIGGNSEHYAGFTYVSEGGRRFVLSFEAKGKGTPNGRMQLLDSGQNGAYLDFDFDAKKFTVTRLGLSRSIDGGMEPVGDGWYRVWVTARLLKDGGSIIIQLGTRDANWVFPPNGESLSIRAVAVRQEDSVSLSGGAEKPN